jgi:hypothetical protein
LPKTPVSIFPLTSPFKFSIFYCKFTLSLKIRGKRAFIGAIPYMKSAPSFGMANLAPGEHRTVLVQRSVKGFGAVGSFLGDLFDEQKTSNHIAWLGCCPSFPLRVLSAYV